jgi:hypothetical protein
MHNKQVKMLRINQIKAALVEQNSKMGKNEIIIYNTDDGRTAVALMAKDGNVWLNQQMLAGLFDISKQYISWHIINILNEKELNANSVVKDYLTTAAADKNCHIKIEQKNKMATLIKFTKQALNSTFLKQKPERKKIELFKKEFVDLFDRINLKESEECNKNLISAFSKNSYYIKKYHINAMKI